MMIEPIINIVVTTCGEPETLGLLEWLSEKTKDNEHYRILCLKDSTKDVSVYDALFDVDDVQHFLSPMDGNFSEFRNSIHTVVENGEYILFLDADEEISEDFIKNLPAVLKANPKIDLYYLPRNNYVEGITDEYIAKMGWRQDEEGRINYPDHQGRLYKKKNGVVWKNKVHEVIKGVRLYARLNQDWAHLEHRKTIEKQKKQNELYERIN